MIFFHPLIGCRETGRSIWREWLLLVFFTCLACDVLGQPVEPLFREATFEELGNITVTTVSRHDERLFTVPAATSVLTREAVHAAGARTLPEALREVPGLNVAQITADTWAIGARGFQWQFANKLLVMIDGRSIYSPSQGGVRWEDNPVFLEDLAQVEVVRGPGSSIWGANAVNGVINIVSRSAFETQGTYLFGGVGNELETQVGARQGFRISEHAAVRVFGQYQRHADNVLPTGGSAEDGYWLGFGGVRFDWVPSATDSISLQAGFHERRSDYVRTIGTLTQPPTYAVLSTSPVEGSGQYVSGNWRHDWSDGSNLSVRAYWDRSTRDRPQIEETVTTADVDAVYSARPGERQLVSAGLGYRIVDNRTDNGLFAYDPAHNRPKIFSSFVHDEFTLQPGRLKFSLGTKVEHHESTGWNLQPSARLTWLPKDNLTVWGSVGQAVRVPTLSEQTAAFDARVYPPGVLDPVLPGTIRVFGNPDLNPEKLTAYEAGIRWKSDTGWSVDLSGFAYDYQDYVIITSDTVFMQTQPPALILGQRYVNGIVGESYGGELAVRWEAQPWWRLAASCNFVRIQLHTRLLSDPFGYEQDEDTTPHTSIMVTSNWRLGRRWHVHCAGRYVDPVPYYGVPAYTEFDARVAWQATDHFEISLVGRNLLDARHAEYDSALNRRLTELQRSLNLVCQWNY